MNGLRINFGDLPLWVLQAAVVTLLWSTVELLGGVLGRHYQPTQIVGMRYSVHLFILGVACIRPGFTRLWRTRRLLGQLVRGGCMFMMPMSFALAVSRVPVSATWAVFWIAPIAIVALARWQLGERVPLRVWLLVCVGYVGVLIVLMPEGLPIRGAALWPLVMVSSFVVYVILSRRLRDEWIGASLFYTGLVPLVAMIPFMVNSWAPIRAADLLPISGLGASGLALLYFLDRILERAPAALLAPLLYGVVVWDEGLQALGSGFPVTHVLVGLTVVSVSVGVFAIGLRRAAHG